MKKKVNETGDWKRKFMWFFLESDPKEIMKNVRSFDDQTLIKLSQTTDEHPSYGSPREFQIRAINRELKRRFGVSPSGETMKEGEIKIMKENYVKELRALLESEVEQAETLIAARGFSQELQDMIQKLGRLMNEDLPKVADQMRQTFGPDVATGFENQTTGVLQSVLDSLRDGKQNIDNSVAEVSGGAVPTGAVDMEDPSLNDEPEIDPELDAELGVDDVDLDVDLDIEDEVGDEAELDLDLDDEPLGRAKKESIQNLKQKISEARQKLERIRAKREAK